MAASHMEVDTHSKVTRSLTAVDMVGVATVVAAATPAMDLQEEGTVDMVAAGMAGILRRGREEAWAREVELRLVLVPA